MGSWMSQRHIEAMQVKYGLKPYWPEDMPIDETGERRRDFERAIYTTWASIENRHLESDLSEREVTHLCDIAIMATGKRPDRDYYNKSDIQKLRRKDSTQKDYKKWQD